MHLNCTVKSGEDAIFFAKMKIFYKKSWVIMQHSIQEVKVNMAIPETNWLKWPKLALYLLCRQVRLINDKGQVSVALGMEPKLNARQACTLLTQLHYPATKTILREIYLNMWI